MSNDKIREIFLANGFTIKEGLTDLKPYVYAAARALIAELEKDAQNVTAELDAMNANFQGMLTDRNVWRNKARELEKDAARYQWLKARDFCIDKEITGANADATIDAHMNDA